MNELVAIAQYAERINAAWRQSVEGVIEVGRLLAQAKADLAAKSYAGMIEADLPFTARTAQRLIAIAQDERLTTHVSHLPNHWGTLYELTRLDDDTFKARLNDGTICADMERRDIAQAVKANRREQRERELGERQLPTGKFGVIVADPEWSFEPYSRETGMDRAADNHYSTSHTEIIADRDVPSIAADDCILFLWATAPMLADALLVMKRWGFTYKSHLIWRKLRSGNGRGTGYWFTSEHEPLLLGTKGKIVAPVTAMCGSVIEAPATRHSAKPEIILDIIDDHFPTLPKIELNRRGPARPNWAAWGNEAIPQIQNGGNNEQRGLGLL